MDLCLIGQRFREAIKAFDFDTCTRVDFLLDALVDVSLPDGFELHFVNVGDWHGTIMFLYATLHQREFVPGFDARGKLSNKMEDDMYMPASAHYTLLDAIPSREKHLRVENSAEGIWSAFLFHQSDTILPRGWHGNYGREDYIFSLEDLDKVFAVDCSAYRTDAVLPSVKYISKTTGTLTTTYWNNYSGLIRMTYFFEWKSDKVIFKEYKKEVLVEYVSDIRY